MTVDTIESFGKSLNASNQRKTPGQAVKIITTEVIVDKEVGRIKDALKQSTSIKHFNAIEIPSRLKRTNATLKECKSCDENLIKFIFTKHGIEVISDVETIV